MRLPLLNQYWIHRYDGLIARQAGIYRLDPDLIWSVIYEETYFSPWKNGKDGEIGLMQVTPAVGRDWATETGMRELERQMATDPSTILRDPEQNIQIGCWYLEKFYEQYRDAPDPEARMVAAYNAGRAGRGMEPSAARRETVVRRRIHTKDYYSIHSCLRDFDTQTLSQPQRCALIGGVARAQSLLAAGAY